MTFCVDIDNTLLYSKVIDGEYFVSGANEQLVEFLNNQFSLGATIILHTGRHWNNLDLTKEQLAFAGIQYTTLVMGKPVANVYIDDLSVKPEDLF